MANQNPQASSSWLPQTDYGGGFSTKVNRPLPPGQRQELKSEPSQASRALGLASYFLSGSMAINLSQVLGSPLYLINKDWYNTWIAFTKQSWGLLTMTMTQWWAPTTVRVSGDASMRGQLIKTNDPGLMCNFPERLVMVANHQIYTDWLYLWWIGYTAGMHGRIFVVLKESLKKIPVLGWGMQFAQFIFLKRNWEQDKPGLAKHMQHLNQSKDPMWLMLFPEGTNLASCTREKSRKWADRIGVQDMKHTLLPRATGLHFMLNELRTSVDYLYDCTIAYEGVPHGTYAQDIFTVGASYFGGRPPKSVNMYWRRFKTTTIPLDDPKKFELWLRLRWREKDKFIEHYLQKGRFPADTGTNQNFKGECVHGSGYIEAEIRPKYWYEFMQVFAPIGVFALVLYLFYGSLPQEMVNNIKSVDKQTVMQQIEAIQRGDFKVPETKDLMATAPKELQDKFKAIQTLAAQHNTTPEKIIAEAKKGLPAGSLPAGDPGPIPKPATALGSPKKAQQKPLTAGASKLAASTKALPSKSTTTNVKSSKSPATPAANKSAVKSTQSSVSTPARKAPKLPGKAAAAPKALPATKSLPASKGPGNQKSVDQNTAAKPTTRATAAKPAATKPPVSTQANQENKSPPSNTTVRHAMKREARQGKQTAPRKIRRALQES